MNKGLYGKLAVTNMKKNQKFFLPYLVTGIITVAMFYIMSAISRNTGIKQLSGANTVQSMLSFGAFVIGIFSVIFLFYTNSFLMKRRKKELGIYNILGMEKKHIAKVLSIETIITAFLAIGLGIITGIIFDKLMTMLLVQMMGFETSIAFYIDKNCLISTIVLFGIIYLVTLIYNLVQIKLSNPIELLHGGNVGEKEPKTKMIMTIIGVLCIGGGYYIAITTQDPIQAIMLFFGAVILVIVGTYCLFTAGSIAVLKMLRKNKKFYYQTSHFTSVSGMLYRMKQNAVGLANICILSTMVLVMVSTTVSMYIGIDDEVNTRYTNDLSITADYKGEVKGDTEWKQPIEDTIINSGRTIRNEISYSYLNLAAKQEGSDFLTDQNNVSDFNNIAELIFMTKDEFENKTNKKVADLGTGEVVVYSTSDHLTDSFTLMEDTYTIKEVVPEIPAGDVYSAFIINVYYIVVPDQETLYDIYQKQAEAYGENASNMRYEMDIDIDGTDTEKIACYNELENVICKTDNTQTIKGTQTALSIDSKQVNSNDFHAMYGGFFFLGVFLGTMFLMITVLIIFYKQISEGYGDKERFAIMHKVGMSKAEVKKSINSQVRIVFFLPIVTATIHVLAAFPIIKKLLALMNLTNGNLFAGCLAGTIIVFVIIYLLVFLLTSKTYYRIVGEQN